MIGWHADVVSPYFCFAAAEGLSGKRGRRSHRPANLAGGPTARFLVAFCLLFFFVILSGCATPFLPAAKVPPVSVAPSVPSFEIAKLKERSDFWRDYQCKFRIRVDSKSSKFSSRAIVFVKGHSFVRFETFAPLGQTAALFVTNETGPALLIPSEKVIFTAQHPETLVSEFLGVSLPVDLFRYVLAASIPPDRLDHIEPRSDDGIFRLISKSGDGYYEWRFTGNPLALAGLSVRSPQFEGSVSYDPPVGITTEAMPAQILISSSEWSIKIDVEELKPAPQFQPSAFYMPDLPNLRKVDLDKIK